MRRQAKTYALNFLWCFEALVTFIIRDMLLWLRWLMVLPWREREEHVSRVYCVAVPVPVSLPICYGLKVGRVGIAS